MQVQWSSVKSVLTARNLSAQYIVAGTFYWIKAIDGNFEVDCLIPIVTPTPAGSDQADFETNFMPNANASPRANVVQVLGADTLTLSPFGAVTTSGQIVAGQTTNWDIQIPTTLVLRGGVFFSTNSAFGDWISVSVIDKDNTTGQGGTPDAPTVLGTYIISWYIMPGVENRIEDVSISEQLMNGLYLRVAYTSVGADSPNAIINFISYVGTP